jgi:DNA repair exonuclease SbcCD ATPase subunit
MTCGYEFTNSVTKCPVCKTTRQFRKEETLELQFKGSAFNIEFSEDSGGGKLLVSLAVRLALFTALRDRGYMRGVDWWVMDEVFSPLDTAAKAAMLNFLDDLRDLYGFKQLFIISHTDLSDVIPPAIIIERDADTQSSVILA